MDRAAKSADPRHGVVTEAGERILTMAAEGDQDSHSDDLATGYVPWVTARGTATPE